MEILKKSSYADISQNFIQVSCRSKLSTVYINKFDSSFNPESLKFILLKTYLKKYIMFSLRTSIGWAILWKIRSYALMRVIT